MNLAIDREEQRERDAGASLEDTRVRERDAMEEVSTLQRSLTSSVAEWQESAPSWRGGKLGVWFVQGVRERSYTYPPRSLLSPSCTVW